MPSLRDRRVMCLTRDSLPLSHLEQVEGLCQAGARFIQLRVKSSTREAWLELARDAGAICRRYGATCVVNDDVEIALAAGADGVHLGRNDLPWTEARRRLGPTCLLGGTVNDLAGAREARECGVLDYVGVGPLRFTTTKRGLAPVLGLPGVRALIDAMGDLPAWVIGGVEAGDVAELRAAGAAGVAVSSALFRGPSITANLDSFTTAWSNTLKAESLP